MNIGFSLWTEGKFSTFSPQDHSAQPSIGTVTSAGATTSTKETRWDKGWSTPQQEVDEDILGLFGGLTKDDYKRLMPSKEDLDIVEKEEYEESMRQMREEASLKRRRIDERQKKKRDNEKK